MLEQGVDGGQNVVIHCFKIPHISFAVAHAAIVKTHGGDALSGQLACKQGELPMAAGAILRPPYRDEHTRFGRRFRQGGDAQQAAISAVENNGLLGVFHGCPRTASDVASIRLGHSVISWVTQKDSPFKVRVCTFTPAVRQASTIRWLDGLGVSLSSAPISIHSTGQGGGVSASFRRARSRAMVTPNI